MGAITLHNPLPDKFVKELFLSVDGKLECNCDQNRGRLAEFDDQDFGLARVQSSW